MREAARGCRARARRAERRELQRELGQLSRGGVVQLLCHRLRAPLEVHPLVSRELLQAGYPRRRRHSPQRRGASVLELLAEGPRRRLQRHGRTAALPTKRRAEEEWRRKPGGEDHRADHRQYPPEEHHREGTAPTRSRAPAQGSLVEAHREDAPNRRARCGLLLLVNDWEHRGEATSRKVAVGGGERHREGELLRLVKEPPREGASPRQLMDGR
mmetsp:Transcript_5735/g.14088  ORF Transcript_5735/g.14088 Transcript_5735/m.14088 type:complete len:214 (+) Transcript_5735:953-1594(+)